ncbi:hypothetical protein XELAEV_18012954mg [Xenopus laevis]|uniref:Uncharacterized protein n=1 Tax=Xenopus laevis TaxID=8355 RepID=A0A974HYX4_XENLA|nr:hypothetical protein XELAEV_18012954mg [Xenopus laevis]
MVTNCCYYATILAAVLVSGQGVALSRPLIPMVPFHNYLYYLIFFYGASVHWLLHALYCNFWVPGCSYSGPFNLAASASPSPILLPFWGLTCPWKGHLVLESALLCGAFDSVV